MPEPMKHLISNKGRDAKAACVNSWIPTTRIDRASLVETVGEVTCPECIELLKAMYSPRSVA